MPKAGHVSVKIMSTKKVALSLTVIICLLAGYAKGNNEGKLHLFVESIISDPK